MNVSISSGNYDVIASGETFLFSESDGLTLDITGNGDFNPSIVFQFVKDDSGELKTEVSIVENKLILSCVNYEGFGRGLTRPMEIADLDGKKLFLIFWTYREGGEKNKVRSVKYTLFCEK